MKIKIHVLCLLVAGCSFLSAAPRVEEVETLESPDGLYRAMHLMEFDEDGAVSHFYRVFEKDRASKALTVGPLTRGVEWIWAPDHRHAAVIWHALSNQSGTLVLEQEAGGEFRLPGDKPGDSEDELSDAAENLSGEFWKLFNRENSMQLAPDHDYVNALAWLDDRTLVLAGRGYESGGHEGSADGWVALYDVQQGRFSVDWEAWRKSHGKLPPMRPVWSDSSQFDSDAASVVKNGNGYEVWISQQKDAWAEPKPGSRKMLLRGEGLCSLRVAPENRAMAMNTLKPGGKARVQLFVRKTTMDRFAEAMPEETLVKTFAKDAGWKAEDAASVEMQAVGWLDSGTVILQGEMQDSGGKPQVHHTALYDVGQGRFLSGLQEFNRSKVEHPEKR